MPYAASHAGRKKVEGEEMMKGEDKSKQEMVLGEITTERRSYDLRKYEEPNISGTLQNCDLDSSCSCRW